MRVNIDVGTQTQVLSLVNISLDIISNMRLWSNHLYHTDIVVFWGGCGGMVEREGDGALNVCPPAEWLRV